MPTLYRKYRPQTFADLSGQEHIVQTITNEVAMGKIAHAYVFSGPRGVGKTTMARLLAKAVNCSNRKTETSEPCDTCSSCQEITAGNNIDVIEIDAASHTGVDNVRENIIDNARFQPTKSKYKVFIIDEVHMLSGSAFNALLKTLEEPPAHAIFILATTELHKIPATVVSRCERYQFKKIPYDSMMERLKKICADEKIKVDTDVLERVVKKSEGGLRDAESLLGQLFSLGLKKITAQDVAMVLPLSSVDSVLDFIETATNEDATNAFTTLKNVATDGLSMDQFALELVEVLRAALIVASTNDTKTLAGDYSDSAIKRIRKIATSVATTKLVALIEDALVRRQQLKTSPIPTLPLELWVIGCAAPIATNTPSQTPILATSKPVLASITPPTPASPVKSETVPTQPPTSAPEKHTLKESIKSAISTITGNHTPKTTLEEIRAQWPQIVAGIATNNHSLNFILNSGKLGSVDHEGLHIVFPYTIHQDKINEVKNKRLVEDALAKTFNEKIHIIADVVKTPEPEPINEQELSNLAVEFGGEVVG